MPLSAIYLSWYTVSSAWNDLKRKSNPSIENGKTTIKVPYYTRASGSSYQRDITVTATLLDLQGRELARAVDNNIKFSSDEKEKEIMHLVYPGILDNDAVYKVHVTASGVIRLGDNKGKPLIANPIAFTFSRAKGLIEYTENDKSKPIQPATTTTPSGSQTSGTTPTSQQGSATTPTTTTGEPAKAWYEDTTTLIVLVFAGLLALAIVIIQRYGGY